jgi:hypothetical protein
VDRFVFPSAFGKQMNFELRLQINGFPFRKKKAGAVPGQRNSAQAIGTFHPVRSRPPAPEEMIAFIKHDQALSNLAQNVNLTTADQGRCHSHRI